MPLRFLIPEMGYAALMCVLLIRGYPSEVKMEDVVDAADTLVDVVKVRMQKQQDDKTDESKAKN